MRTKCTAVALSLLVGLGGIALAPSAGAAQTPPSAPPPVERLVKAPGFKVTGKWAIYQSNQIHATVDVTQDTQGNLSGTAKKTTGTMVDGIIEQGFVDGNYIYFVINWEDRTKGRYIGSLGADRTLSGDSTDLSTPGSEAKWSTRQTF
ncbi:hypothetical protein [Streptomyces lasiicapitis]|uniref:Uncharacterized protein n=1 Tax=Streptomyces lasiicapitis TaxID=1923961 RepID=A0ABQ2LQK5_9ACTN|nr:hypothetical protein [Streptomyces lasiicapitis]GGO42089.1 hypothetical protein GCM10012286_22820 [Streptomyces lasiicapitis]